MKQRRIQYQPIPHLAPNDSAWAWTVSDGTFIVGRFNSREYAEAFKATLVGSHGTQPVSDSEPVGTERSAEEDLP
jgi:hypothetical protein